MPIINMSDEEMRKATAEFIRLARASSKGTAAYRAVCKSVYNAMPKQTRLVFSSLVKEGPFHETAAPSFVKNDLVDWRLVTKDLVVKGETGFYAATLFGFDVWTAGNEQ